MLVLALGCRGRDAVVMQTSRDLAINLSFSDAVTVLMEACCVPPPVRKAFEARIRHLQRLGIPARPADERNSRITYGIVELAMLATTFRLMAAFMIPVLAVRYVNERWAELAPFTLAGARDVLPEAYLARRPMTGGTVAVIEGNALADLGQKGRLDERYAGALGEVLVVDADTRDIVLRVRGAGTVIDSRTYMPVIVTRTVELAMATDADLAMELDRLRFVAGRR